MLTDQTFLCDENEVLPFTCESECGCNENELFCPSTCENVLFNDISNPLLGDTAFEEIFCSEVIDSDKFARGSNGNKIDVCRGGEVRQLTCLQGGKSFCGEDGIFLASTNDEEVLNIGCLGPGLDTVNCPDLQFTVPVDKAKVLLDAFDLA